MTSTTTSPTVLQFHNWRLQRGDDQNEMTALFLFSLLPEERFKAGEAPGQTDTFWTEVGLSRAVAEQPGWKKLGRSDKVKCMFQHAVEQIVTAKRKLRQAPVLWTTSAKHRNAPAWDPASIEFPRAKPVTFDAAETEGSSRFLARKGAGLAS